MKNLKKNFKKVWKEFWENSDEIWWKFIWIFSKNFCKILSKSFRKILVWKKLKIVKNLLNFWENFRENLSIVEEILINIYWNFSMLIENSKEFSKKFERNHGKT